MLTWYQDNFTGVLNRLAGSEAMPGKNRGKEHALDVAYKIPVMALGNTQNSPILGG